MGESDPSDTGVEKHIQHTFSSHCLLPASKLCHVRFLMYVKQHTVSPVILLKIPYCSGVQAIFLLTIFCRQHWMNLSNQKINLL